MYSHNSLVFTMIAIHGWGFLPSCVLIQLILLLASIVCKYVVMTILRPIDIVMDYGTMETLHDEHGSI